MKKMILPINLLYIIKQRAFNNLFIYLLSLSLFSASCKEEVASDKNKPLPPGPPKEENKGRFDTDPFKWDYVFSTTTKDDIFIGDKYISVENRYIITPPSLYVGAAYSEKTFGTSFSPELTTPRNSIDVIFDFTRPFTGTIDKEYGSIGYKEMLAKSLDSREYREYIKDRRPPFDISLVEIYSYADINKAFPENEGRLGELLSKEAEKNSKVKDIKSRLTGKLSSKSFTVYMDYPVNGFFKDKKNDISQENPVYIQTISYGKAAFFVIESEYSYKEVSEAILSKLSLSNINDKVDILKNSTITLFTISDNLQIAKIYSSFQNLDIFLNTSFSEESYGYPIYCQGVYTKDNTSFRKKSKN